VTASPFNLAYNGRQTVDLAGEKPWKVSLFVSTALSDPRGITTDGTYFYVTNYSTNNVVKIDSTGVVLSQINVGNCSLGIVTVGTDLYVVVGINNGNKIRKIPISASTPTDFVTGLSYAYGITSVGGFLYVVEANSCSISKVDSVGTRTQFAGGTQGNGDNQFSRPTGIAADGGFLYVTDYSNHTIKQVNMSTQQIVTLAGSSGNTGTQDGTGSGAQFNLPIDVKPDGAGNLYVVHFNGNSVRKVQIATGKVTTLSLVDGSLSNTRALCISGGDLYVADGNSIKKLTQNW
jgi:DNA-binding beta-propeller fold protein YncE